MDNNSTNTPGEKTKLQKGDSGIVRQDELNSTQSNFNETAKNVSDAFEKGGKLFSKILGQTNSLAETRRDIESIKAKTEIELHKIDKSHEINMALIRNEYGKQARAMNIAEDVVAKGLEDDDLNKIALGLQNVTGIANHNPFENFHKDLDNDLKKLNKGMEDDDFIIEI
jgi:hypothetical protein